MQRFVRAISIYSTIGFAVTSFVMCWALDELHDLREQRSNRLTTIAQLCGTRDSLWEQLASAQSEADHYKRISMSQEASRRESDPMLLDVPWAVVPCGVPRDPPPETADEFAEMWRFGKVVVHTLSDELSFAIVKNAAADTGRVVNGVADGCRDEDPIEP